MAREKPDAALRVGQIWKDYGITGGRQLRITAVLPNGASMEIVGTGRSSRALLHRFGRAGGYELVEEPLAVDAVDPHAANQD